MQKKQKQKKTLLLLAMDSESLWLHAAVYSAAC